MTLFLLVSHLYSACPPAVAEVLGLYGLIVALILNTRSQDAPNCMISK